jgi:hypothetical protein
MPKKQLTVRLWSPGLAPDKSFARLAIPTGLKLGKQLDLDLYRPEASKAQGGAGEAVDPGKVPDFTLIRYWGSSATVKKGQPEVIKFADLPQAEKDAAREEAMKSQQGNDYFYKPDWTTGYWPTKKQPGAIADNVLLAGRYDLTTNYTGNVGLDVPDTVRFLNPIEFASPNLAAKIDFSKPMVFKWKPIPGVLGYHAYIVAMKGEKTLITWSSSEVPEDPGLSLDYLEMAQVSALRKTAVFMAPDRTEVIVPAGIFKECDTVYLTMVGYGPGTALDAGQPLPRLQTKTTLTIMLGGKAMEGLGDGEEEDDGGAANNEE